MLLIVHLLNTISRHAYDVSLLHQHPLATLCCDTLLTYPINSPYQLTYFVKDVRVEEEILSVEKKMAKLKIDLTVLRKTLSDTKKGQDETKLKLQYVNEELKRREQFMVEERDQMSGQEFAAAQSIIEALQIEKLDLQASIDVVDQMDAKTKQFEAPLLQKIADKAAELQKLNNSLTQRQERRRQGMILFFDKESDAVRTLGLKLSVEQDVLEETIAVGEAGAKAVFESALEGVPRLARVLTQSSDGSGKVAAITASASTSSPPAQALTTIGGGSGNHDSQLALTAGGTPSSMDLGDREILRLPMITEGLRLKRQQLMSLSPKLARVMAPAEALLLEELRVRERAFAQQQRMRRYLKERMDKERADLFVFDTFREEFAANANAVQAYLKGIRHQKAVQRDFNERNFKLAEERNTRLSQLKVCVFIPLL